MVGFIVIRKDALCTTAVENASRFPFSHRSGGNLSGQSQNGKGPTLAA